MVCALADPEKQGHPNRARFAIVVVLMGVPMAVDMSSAQTAMASAVSVVCNGAATVPAENLRSVCADLHMALVQKYPKSSFVLNSNDLRTGPAFVALEALSASSTGIEARLNWKMPGTDTVTGPAIGFSISDQVMTPKLQKTFLDSLLNATPLPF